MSHNNFRKCDDSRRATYLYNAIIWLRFVTVRPANWRRRRTGREWNETCRNISLQYNQHISTVQPTYLYSTTNKMQRFLDLFISINCFRCSRQFLRPSSGAQNCTYSVRHCQTNTAACCYRSISSTVAINCVTLHLIGYIL
jgi:hypothetical protein